MANIKGPRRNILKAFITLTGALVIAPFVPMGRFLTSEAKDRIQRQKIGNTSQLATNSRLVFTYPMTGDPEKDSDPFRKFLLIRKPDGQFKAFSMVCLHLWCLADYKPERKQIECPCHGSIYNMDTGVAFKGPAAVQQNKTLPEVKLEVAGNGDIYAISVEGIIGYGKQTAV